VATALSSGGRDGVVRERNPRVIAVCLKWVDRRPEVDPISGFVADDDRWFGCSAADSAALELALQLGERADVPVLAVSAGPSAADALLRDAIARGAAHARRVDTAPGLSSADTAEALAAALEDAAWVLCGDYSIDRGSGSVPAFLAHHLGAAQALGLLSIDIPPAPSLLGADLSDARLDVVRRLDGGRRERLRVSAPAVVSVEGSAATLRRAGLKASLAASSCPIEVVGAAKSASPHATVAVRPWRPRARAFAAPAGDDALSRLRVLTGQGVSRTPPRRLAAEPEDAAQSILDQLVEWGYLGRTE
jgi:electron transfer flavoprotein beta subunit